MAAAVRKVTEGLVPAIVVAGIAAPPFDLVIGVTDGTICNVFGSAEAAG